MFNLSVFACVQGFESRGTEISNRMRSHNELLESTHPGFRHMPPIQPNPHSSTPQQHQHRHHQQPDLDPKVVTRGHLGDGNVTYEVHLEGLDDGGVYYMDNVTGVDTFFCDIPSKSNKYVVLVIIL